MSIDVDTGRLGREAGTLSGQGASLNQAHENLSRATALGTGSCGSVSDDGLRDALKRLADAWGFEVQAISSDLATTSGVMNTLARLYAQVDGQGASTLGASGGQA